MPNADNLARLTAGVWELDTVETFAVQLPFTHERWHGRMKTIRGISASVLTKEQIADWEREHLAYLLTQPEEFLIPHFIKIHKLRRAYGLRAKQ
ncbi:MAG: hypothetical protein LBC38_02450 [Oscillospiraceae bacterium]|jgi:hypothetical protein|nr:hypothetical protein [Oscillospiraceae bacterium]